MSLLLLFAGAGTAGAAAPTFAGVVGAFEVSIKRSRAVSITIITLLLALWSTSAEAQPRTDYLRVEHTLPPLMLGAGFDLWSFEHRDRQLRASGQRLVEGNPAGQGTGERTAIQFAHVAGGLLVVHHVDRRWGRKAGKRTLIALTVLKVGLGVRNLTVGRK